MDLTRTPLALALVLAVGIAASGCAPDAPEPATGTPAAEHAPIADVDTHEAVETHDAVHAHDDHDVSHAAGMDFPVPDDHVQWQPDAPLMEGMSRVRTAVEGLEQADDEATVLAHASDVDAAVDYMFENCSLPVEPDIALHAVLARLMAGTQALRADPADTAPVHDMHAAVDNYETLFDDPNADPAS